MVKYTVTTILNKKQNELSSALKFNTLFQKAMFNNLAVSLRPPFQMLIMKKQTTQLCTTAMRDLAPMGQTT